MPEQIKDVSPWFTDDYRPIIAVLDGSKKALIVAS
jgi:hypothetical protein